MNLKKAALLLGSQFKKQSNMGRKSKQLDPEVAGLTAAEIGRL